MTCITDPNMRDPPLPPKARYTSPDGCSMIVGDVDDSGLFPAAGKLSEGPGIRNVRSELRDRSVNVHGLGHSPNALGTPGREKSASWKSG